MSGMVSFGGSCCMSFEHVGDAGGRVAVLGTKLCEICLGLVVEGGIAAELRACASRWSLPRQES